MLAQDVHPVWLLFLGEARGVLRRCVQGRGVVRTEKVTAGTAMSPGVSRVQMLEGWRKGFSFQDSQWLLPF